MNDLPSHQGRGAGRRALACLLVLLAAVTAGPAYPAQLQLTTSNPETAAAQVPVKDNVVELSLEQAITLALSQNLGIVVQRFNRQQAALGVYQALGIYDLLATGTLTDTSNQQAPTSSIVATTQKRIALNLGVAQLLPTGGDFQIAFNNSRLTTNLPAEFQSLNPEYDSLLNLVYTQPLLKNFGRLQTERQILIARRNSEISRQEFEHQATLILQQVENAYWNLVEARAQLGVAQESLGLAKELHERNKVQVQVGTMAPLELVQSEAQIATQEEAIITAHAAVENAADALRQLVNLPTANLWDKDIKPVTDAQTEHIAVNLPEAVKTALERRPELHSQQLQVDIARVNALFFHGQKKPQLDLAVQYGWNAAGKDVNAALNQISGTDFPGWQAQLKLTVPIQNRAARAQSVIADIDVAKSQVQLDALTTQIYTEVRTASRGVDTAAKQIDASRASRQFQDKNLDAEKKKYENGMSTSFEITRIQNDLTQARSNEVTAIVQYRRALTEYYRATGRLLQQEGIVVDDQEPPGQRFSFHNGAIEKYEPGKTAQPDAPPANPPATSASPAPAATPPANPPATPPPGSSHGAGRQ
ncbi:MAG TPA: TolC family protein [Thermoanaerobaculia bacterium]|nr:TolC family protein [Thermoanaerobaculia bacterium]